MLNYNQVLMVITKKIRLPETLSAQDEEIRLWIRLCIRLLRNTTWGHKTQGADDSGQVFPNQEFQIQPKKDTKDKHQIRKLKNGGQNSSYNFCAESFGTK